MHEVKHDLKHVVEITEACRNILPPNSMGIVTLIVEILLKSLYQTNYCTTAGIKGQAESFRIKREVSLPRYAIWLMNLARRTKD